MQQPRAEGNDMGRVTFCSAADCAYNDARRCVAPHVDVGRHMDPQGRHADCETYTQNQHPEEPIR
ncbi:MAG: DUF1540 domain-containing protein [Chloroflexi bacterium]|nr:DUF1540 domain-containing protein [Chloroflexota bacterium]